MDRECRPTLSDTSKPDSLIIITSLNILLRIDWETAASYFKVVLLSLCSVMDFHMHDALTCTKLWEPRFQKHRRGSVFLRKAVKQASKISIRTLCFGEWFPRVQFEFTLYLPQKRNLSFSLFFTKKRIDLHLPNQILRIDQGGHGRYSHSRSSRWHYRWMQNQLINERAI